MKGRLVTLAAIASLLLCLGTGVLWVRSYYVADTLRFYDDEGLAFVRVARGHVWFWRVERGAPSLERAREHHAAGFTYFATTQRSTWGVGCPLWFLNVVFTLMPLYWGRCKLRAPDGGRCPNCGYDLRATTERCPECGTVAPAARSGPSTLKSAAVV